MCFKVFIVTLAAVSVSSRPQIGLLQPQRQFVQVTESIVYSDSLVRNRAVGVNSRHNTAATNQFLNAEVREIQTNNNRRETTQLELHKKTNTEAFISSKLNHTENNRNKSANINTQLSNRKLIDERNRTSVNTNYSPSKQQSTSKLDDKPLQTNKRRNPVNTRLRESISAQNKTISNITNFNQDLYRNTAIHSSPGPQQNNQFAQNYNILNNRAPSIRDNRTYSNPQIDNSNQTYSANPNYRSNGDINDQNRRTVSNIANASNGSPSNSSFQSERPAFTNMKHDQVEITGDHNEEEDKWIWGYSNVTERGVTGTAPDLDDRANFDGGSCPTGQAKVGMKCVDKD